MEAPPWQKTSPEEQGTLNQAVRTTPIKSLENKTRPSNAMKSFVERANVRVAIAKQTGCLHVIFMHGNRRRLDSSYVWNSKKS